MDVKAVEGLLMYASLWPGPVRCLTRSVPVAGQPYFAEYDPKELPFELSFIDELADARALLDESSVILAPADDHRDVAAVWLTKRPVVYVIEYTLPTRLQILSVSSAGRMARLKSAAWVMGMEMKRRSAFKAARGIQANGLPAFEAYGKLNPHSLLFYDTRLAARHGAGADALAHKKGGAVAGEAIRLAFSGRLERMKGADYLIPLAALLRERGVHFSLDIYGEGDLRPELERGAGKAGLDNIVRFHGPVSFEDELVPALKESVDLFVCCHTQGDPSCTYLETLGCGVPIVGFGNPALNGVLALGPCGAATKVGDIHGLADIIAGLAADRTRLARMIDGAGAAARGRFFENEFARRVEHLREAVAG